MKKPFLWGKCWREPAIIFPRGVIEDYADPNRWQSTEGKRNQHRISWSMIYDSSMIDWKQKTPKYHTIFTCEISGVAEKQGQKLKDKVNFSAALRCLKHSLARESPLQINTAGLRTLITMYTCMDQEDKKLSSKPLKHNIPELRS